MNTLARKCGDLHSLEASGKRILNPLFVQKISERPQIQVEVLGF